MVFNFLKRDRVSAEDLVAVILSSVKNGNYVELSLSSDREPSLKSTLEKIFHDLRTDPTVKSAFYSNPANPYNMEHAVKIFLDSGILLSCEQGAGFMVNSHVRPRADDTKAKISENLYDALLEKGKTLYK